MGGVVYLLSSLALIWICSSFPFSSDNPLMMTSDSDEQFEEHTDAGVIAHLALTNHASMEIPEPRSDHTLFYREKNALFLFGGLGASQNPLGDFWMYRLDTHTWVRIGGDGTAFPSARCWHAVSLKCDGSKVYLFGGFDSSADLKDLWRFSFEENQWKELKPNSVSPPARDRHSMVTYQKSLIVFGGYSGEYMNDMWRFSIDDNSWNLIETKAPSSGGPSPRRSHGMTIIKNMIYMFGGSNNDRTFGDLWAFNIETSTWRQIDSSSRPSRRTRMGLISDGRADIFMFGGFDSANYKYDLWHFEEGAGWQEVETNNDSPIERADFDIAFQRSGNAADKGRVYLFGGFDGKSKYNDLYQYEIASREWEVISTGSSRN
eukprot:c12832_g1_i1.p1 GENE.c12832_g1_i1~~c12832_g1_i1.p1  ORF type:complete len:375 (-),score=146.21 c12832_g1_i1:69-1193(-)